MYKRESRLSDEKDNNGNSSIIRSTGTTKRSVKYPWYPNDLISNDFSSWSRNNRDARAEFTELRRSDFSREFIKH